MPRWLVRASAVRRRQHAREWGPKEWQWVGLIGDLHVIGS